MPYIDPEIREALLEHEPDVTWSEGELNFWLTTHVLRWLGSDYRYTRLNGAIGVLECIQQELYRRTVVPYEELKRKENGDVYQ